MERLSNIIRTTQRRQSGETRSFQHTAQEQKGQPGQRGQTEQPGQQRQPAQRPARTSLPEQTGHMGPNTRLPRVYHARNIPGASNPATPRSPRALPPHPRDEQEEGWEDAPPIPARQAARSTASFQRSSYAEPETRYTRQPANGDYYQPDTRVSIVPADVQEEWEDGEDGTGEMRYGDWEGEDEYAPPTRARGREREEDAVESGEVVNRGATRTGRVYGERDTVLPPRELYRVPGPTPKTHVTRNLRDARLPVPAVPTATPQLPAPQAGAREVRPEARRPQHPTQPLKPQQSTRVNETPQKPARVQKPVPARQEVVGIYSPQVPAVICPVCKGAGFLRSDVPFGHPNFGKPVACECKEKERKARRRLQLQEMSNLNAFSDKSFENFNPRVAGMLEAYKIAAEFARNPDGWLMLIGPNGCGKTHLAAAIANQSLEDGALVLFATVPDLLDHLRAAFAPSATEVFDQLFARMREAEVLVLDDLGAQQSSPWANEKLFQLLNYRYNLRFPTVITANPKGLQAIDERIRSRLSDASLVTTMKIDRAMDYRPHNPRRD